MSTVIDSLERAQLRRVPTFDAGDRLRVHFQVIEGTRRRTQVFEGVVIKRQGHGARETFTVRKQSFGVGRRADVPAALAEDRADRGRRARRRPARQAVLPARSRRQARPRARAPLAPPPRSRSSASCCTRRRRRSPRQAVEEDAGAADRRAERPTRSRGAPRLPAEASGAEESSAAESEESAPPTAPQDASPAADGGIRRRTSRSDEGEEVAARARLIELAVIVVTALGLALAIQAFLVKPYRIPSGSMLPTVHINQRVLVDRIGMRLLLAARRRHHRVPPAEELRRRLRQSRARARTPAGRTPRRPAQVAVEAAVLADVHQARRRAPGRSALDPQRPRDPQRQARARRLHRAVRRRLGRATSRRRSRFPGATTT